MKKVEMSPWSMKSWWYFVSIDEKLVILSGYDVCESWVVRAARRTQVFLRRKIFKAVLLVE